MKDKNDHEAACCKDIGCCMDSGAAKSELRKLVYAKAPMAAWVK